MTTWSVVKEDTGEKQKRGLTARFLPRIALLVCVAVVVLSLGVALTPRSPKHPAEPPFSQQARAAALAETLRLRDAVEQLGRSAHGAVQGPLAQTVTLLTTQARALLSPGEDPATSVPQGSPAPSAAASAPPPLPSTGAAVAAELAAGAGRRLADAAAADGGMARLLAAVGTAQLLQASSLAAAAGGGAPAVGGAPPAPEGPASPDVAGTCPAAIATTPAGSPDSATLAHALQAAVRTEQRIVYGYQLALPRLGGGPAKSAAAQLDRHEALLAGAGALSLQNCVAPPPPEAGYALAPSLLADPAAGLAAMETAALPVYGDLVALGDGYTRRWAISALLDTARAAAGWGTDPGPLPGLTADPASFPPLPAATATPAG